MTPALAIRGLEKSFPGHLSIGRTRVLDGLHLEVAAGETYGFIGANGAGKTTTIKILTGLIFADAGSAHILGEPVPSPRSRSRLGFLPEHPAFYGYLTGREFLLFHARLLGLEPARRHVDEVLDQVGMADRAGRALRRCSKGMQQRIGIAQAILGSPDVLVLDEPMSGLDPTGRSDVRDIILAQRQRGATVFFSSHILSDAEMLCHRVGILREGKLALEGRVEDLLTDGEPSWEVTATGAAAFEEHNGFKVVSRQGDRVLMRVAGEKALDELLDELRARGARLRSLQPHRHSLEERYLDVVKGKDR